MTYRKPFLNAFKDQSTETKTFHDCGPYVIACDVPDGWPKPKIDWKLDEGGQKTNIENNDIWTKGPNGNLYIADFVAKYQKTKFICEVSIENITTMEKQYRSLHHICDPKMSPSNNETGPIKQFVDETIEAVMNERVEIFCIYGGSKLKTIWKKNDKELENYRNKKSIVIERMNEENYGTYTCEVSNNVGNQTSSINLIVAVPPQKINIITDPGVDNNKYIDLRCTVDENRFVPLKNHWFIKKWFFNGQPVEMLNFTTNTHSHDLRIPHFSQKYMGIYGCHVNNSAGYAYNEIFVGDFSESMKLNETLMAQLDNDVTINCRIYGIANSSVKWFHGDLTNELNRNDEHYVFNESTSTLTIKNIKETDAGIYICKVSNIWGMKTDNVTIIVENPIVPKNNPTNVEFKKLKQSAIVISWESMNQTDLWYRIYWKQDFHNENWTIINIVNWKQNKFTITNQAFNKPYRFKVMAVNSIGESNAAANESSIPADCSLKAIPLNSTSILLQWKERSIKEAYVIRKSQQNDQWEKIPVQNSRTQIKLTGLKPNVIYRLSYFTNQSNDDRNEMHEP